MKETLPHTIDKLFWNIAVNDDENAFKTLFFQFFSPLCIFAHRYIERWETCEDVVQESFLKIWENRKSIRIETSARNFLVTSVRNNCIDYLRKVELSSAYGLVSKITLPDGSEVWLNSGSKLHYPKQFVGDHRKVYLSGEAYFKVSSDKKHRFDVALSNGITVSAYGTEFNINAYEDDDEIQATLANGSIEIRNEKKPIPQVLNPGEQAVYNKITDNTKVSDINLYMVTSWKEGKMVFRRTEMAEIAQRLSRHFNVNIILQSKKIFNYKYSATFTTETFEEILQLLEKTAPIKCTMIEPKQASDYSYTRRTVIIEAR